MRWPKFLRRSAWHEERGREIASYFEIETAENIARGMSPSDATAAAIRKFGNPVQIREEIYRMNTISWFDSTWQDLRYGARHLVTNPGFAIVAILSLALGIGANTAIFQLLDAVRLRTLPARNPQELAEVRIAGGNGGLGENGDYRTIPDRSHRALAGLSMGGMQTLFIALHHPEKFAYIGSFSGPIIPGLNAPPATPGSAFDTKTAFDGAFANVPEFNRQNKLFWLGVGSEEGQFRSGTKGAADALQSAGVHVVYFESPGAAHEWLTWRRALHNFAPRLFQ